MTHTDLFLSATLRQLSLTAILALGTFLVMPASSAMAQDQDISFTAPIILKLEPTQETYSYRKVSKERTLNIMLFGFQNQTTATPAVAAIPKTRQSLDSFFKQHVDRIRNDVQARESGDTFRFIAGDQSFTSQNLNRGTQIEPAKMAGVTFPIGAFTVGGGYTWDEQNPALMLRNTDGMFAGISYDTGKVGYQLSYLASGQELVGWEIGGGDYRYQSVMFGTSFRVNNRMSMTTTLQYRTDNDPLTTGDRHAVVTVGTRWRF